jgi:hypothetical protein
MIKENIIKQLNISKANIIPYYYENKSIPKSIQKYININAMIKENYYNITIELFDIMRQKSNGMLYGVCREIGEKLNYSNNYNYIFCAPTICSILICLFQFKNMKIIIFPYLSLTKIKYNYNQLSYIINQIKNIFNLNNEVDLSFMKDYNEDPNNTIVFNKKYNFKNMYMYLYNVIKNNYNVNALCVIEELYNDNYTDINISKQLRNMEMQLCDSFNKNIFIRLKNNYNLPIIHQIVENTNTILFNLLS